MSRCVRPSFPPAGPSSRVRQKNRACLETLENRVLLSSTLLTNGTGDGKLSILVDEYGGYGTATGAGDAIYDPVGPLGPGGTTANSSVYISYGTAGFLMTPEQPSIGFDSVTPTTAVSSFFSQGVLITLTQRLLSDSQGSELVQTYQVRNQTPLDADFKVVRHVDGNMTYRAGVNNDLAGAAGDGETLYEFDNAGGAGAATPYFSIGATGGDSAGYTIQPSPYTNAIRVAGGIPGGDVGQVAGDGNGDRLTDAGYNVTLSLQNHMLVASFGTQTYTTTTRFSQGVPSELVSGAARPQARILAIAPVTSAGVTSTAVTVEYTDNSEIDASSIDASDLLVSLNGGPPLAVTLGAVAPSGPSATKTVTYNVTPTGGTWDNSDNGTYTVSVDANRVRDTSGQGNTAATAPLVVNVPPPPPLPAPSADSGFAPVSADFATEAVAAQSTGKVVAAGHRGALGASRFVLRRFNADGTPDTSFGGTGEIQGPAGAGEAFYALAIDAADRIVAAGVSAGNFLLARFNPDGTPDATFGTAGRVVSDFSDIGGATDVAYALATGPDGSVVVGGGSNGAFAFARYTPAGALDPAFGEGGRKRYDIGTSGDVIGAIGVQSDGRVVIAGAGGTAGTRVLAARLLPNGDPDPAFGGTGFPIIALEGLAARTDLGEADRTEGLAIQSDDKILIANTTASGDFGVLRLTRDGLPDPTFGQGGLATADFGGDDDADAVIVQGGALGQVLVVGTSGSTSAPPQLAIAAFDAAGVPLSDYGNGGRVAQDAGLGSDRSFRILAQRVRAVAAVEARTRRLIAGASGDSNSESHTALSRLLVPGAAQEQLVGTFGTVEGQKKPQALTLPNTRLTLSLKGGGTGQVFADASRPGVARLVVTGTNARSVLTIAGLGGRVTLDDSVVDGPLGKVVARVADVAGTLFVRGSIGSMMLGQVAGTAAAPATVAASGEIGMVRLAALQNGRILSGPDLGTNAVLGGGDDVFNAGHIRSLKVDGAVGESFVGAGVDPVNGLFGDADDRAIGGAASRIDKITTRGGTDTATVFAAGSFGKIKKLGRQRVGVPSDPRFHVLQ